jgi:hypothetical protein
VKFGLFVLLAGLALAMSVPHPAAARRGTTLYAAEKLIRERDGRLYAPWAQGAPTRECYAGINSAIPKQDTILEDSGLRCADGTRIMRAKTP